MEKRTPDIQRRCRQLGTGKSGKGPVVYWMSRDQRSEDNWALLRAREEALIAERELLVVFVLIPNYPGANMRHYDFLLKGLMELARTLPKYNIGFNILTGNPVYELAALTSAIDAHSVITDFDPLRIKRDWKNALRKEITCPLWEVDSHNIIPAWLVSDKKEYGAYTLRPKINRLLPDFLTVFPKLSPLPKPASFSFRAPDISELTAIVSDHSITAVSWCQPGQEAAHNAMREALSHRIPGYAAGSNDPCGNCHSRLSPYLHFGQLGPQRLALEVTKATIPACDKDAFLEQLIVRRELSDNFCLQEPQYDSIAGFPEWARRTLREHQSDLRDYVYTPSQWEEARTHDRLWNACQTELVVMGRLHGYLRMYWAKKILEWSESPKQALETAIFLNDRYALDGRDPNGYTGIAWSLGGIHDRAWQERPVFGKVRYMNEKGCRRKFNVDSYIHSVQSHCRIA